MGGARSSTGASILRLLVALVAASLTLPGNTHTRGRFVRRPAGPGETQAWACATYPDCRQVKLGENQPTAFCSKHKGQPFSVNGVWEDD